MDRVCELTIYTSNAALSFNVEATTDDFQERLANAIEDGTVLLNTVEGSRLILNAINVVAIEVREVSLATENVKDAPPGSRICTSFL